MLLPIGNRPFGSKLVFFTMTPGLDNVEGMAGTGGNVEAFDVAGRVDTGEATGRAGMLGGAVAGVEGGGADAGGTAGADTGTGTGEGEDTETGMGAAAGVGVRVCD